ncbi:MAG: hypothetical protein GY702_03440 [Desulfobulbaceae bacterium]|nr:hypothetical protein [Desulfobulbaceae bacterium]
MATPNIQDLLKKINYIEVDIEIQKQILFSIPSDQKDEMEKTVTAIAEKTKEIKELRTKIKEIDPEEFDRIMVFEEAINNFKKLASEKKFESITSRNVGEECSLALSKDKQEECLIKACDSDGNWTIITLSGEIKQFQKTEVVEKPPEKTLQEPTTPFI